MLRRRLFCFADVIDFFIYFYVFLFFVGFGYIVFEVARSMVTKILTHVDGDRNIKLGQEIGATPKKIGGPKTVY